MQTMHLNAAMYGKNDQTESFWIKTNIEKIGICTPKMNTEIRYLYVRNHSNISLILQ